MIVCAPPFFKRASPNPQPNSTRPRPQQQSVEKGKLTADAAAAEAKAVEGRIKYSLDLHDLKDADLVIEVRGRVRERTGEEGAATGRPERRTGRHNINPTRPSTANPNRPSWRTWR